MATMTDNQAIEVFATAMREKMAYKSKQGAGGWQQCSERFLQGLLDDHIAKGDLVDIANLAMMIWHVRERKRIMDVVVVSPLSMEAWLDLMRRIRITREELRHYGTVC